MTTSDVFQIVTDRICEQLAKGVIPWQRPWSVSIDNQAISYVTRKAYSPLNQMLLCEGGEYLTFKQCKALGGSIKKGAKARIVVFYTTSTIKTKVVKDEETVEEQKVTYTKLYDMPVLKAYHVFHLNDCEGIESKLPKKSEDGKAYDTTPIERAEKVITDYVDREQTLTFVNNKPSNVACYNPKTDEIHVPMISQYEDVEEYYSTTFHEIGHSTGHQSRLNRGVGSTLKSSDKYSREELVAEMTSAMLCNMLGIDTVKAFNNSVAYIRGWMSHIRDNKTEIVWAARRAEAAVKYIINEK